MTVSEKLNIGKVRNLRSPHTLFAQPHGRMTIKLLLNHEESKRKAMAGAHLN
jgi:hypothetical protein